MKPNGACIASLGGCIFGFAAVHFIAFRMALEDPALHLSRNAAMWQAVFYDFMVGIPVAALCGWGVAYLVRRPRKEPE